MNSRPIALLLFLFWTTPVFSVDRNVENSSKEFSKHIDVTELDASLPSESLYDWLNGLAKKSEKVEWEFNDCGEQTGTEADRGRDFPKCLEGSIVSSTTHARMLGIQVYVGTWQRGFVGNPEVGLIYYTKPDQSFVEFKNLSTLKETVNSLLTFSPKYLQCNYHNQKEKPMRARVIKIGNSQGLRIPKPILEQTGIMDDVEIEVEKNQIIIRPVKNAREGWDAAFKTMGEQGDDKPLVDDSIATAWDDDEWQW
ncbi:Antitoxin component of the MazEF toxin-antitoxin module [Candidatus Electrothrix marina]|uniref:Antitoxin component of the MazEF toxin-antitoxin module n=1 Tax=Candidatus Electrothrix marina TaxID=1859130 RepID=A0A444JFY2_9BACT|nr:Antitoxin component of the MazEF toxin-antitoxin module [Candidatus Electrothrix marina]